MPAQKPPENPLDVVEDLPPSAKLVYKALEHEGEMTQSELTDETRLAARTARYALEQLEDHGIVTSEPYFIDARKQLYSLQIE